MNKFCKLGALVILCVVHHNAFPMNNSYENENFSPNHIVYTLRNHKNLNIHLVTGDITKIRADAIVNAANEHLMGGSGVDGAIHHAAGPELLRYNMAHFPEVSPGVRCPVGEAKIAPSFELKKNGISWIIHTNGPRGSTKNRKQFLEACYAHSFLVACNKKAKSIAFPAISIGIFGYPIEEAAQTAINSMIDTLTELTIAWKKVFADANSGFDDVYFVLYDSNAKKQEELFRLYENELDRILKQFSGDKKILKRNKPTGSAEPPIKNSGSNNAQSFLSKLFAPPAAPKIGGKKLSEALQEHKDVQKATHYWCLPRAGVMGVFSAVAGFIIGKKVGRPMLVSCASGLLGAGATWLGLQYLKPISQRRNNQKILTEARNLLDDLDPVLEKQAIQDACTQAQAKNPKTNNSKLTQIGTLLGDIINQEH